MSKMISIAVAIMCCCEGLSGASSGPHGLNLVWTGETWERAEPEKLGMDADILGKARDYALTGGGSGCITRHGRLVMQWGDQKQRYDLKSSTKAIGITAVGLALMDGRITSLENRAGKYHPGIGVPPESNAGTDWLDKITLFHLATQTAGFDKNGGYTKLLFEPANRSISRVIPTIRPSSRSSNRLYCR